MHISELIRDEKYGRKMQAISGAITGNYTGQFHRGTYMVGLYSNFWLLN